MHLREIGTAAEASIQILLFLLQWMSVPSARGQVTYHVTPSPNVTCPQDPCLTLAQFAVNSFNYTGHESNVTLIFLPGYHDLENELVLFHSDNISLMADLSQDNSSVIVRCGCELGRFLINDTSFALIKGLHFIGCGPSTVTGVELLVIEDTTFQGAPEGSRGTALMLNKVYSANIEASSFVFNSNDERSNTDANGGALSATSSNVFISNTTFTNNTSLFGGVLSASYSDIEVTHCTFSYNRASAGGVICTIESSIAIENSYFFRNEAKEGGGVLHAFNCTLTIAGDCLFVQNIAVYGGVVYADYGSISIVDSVFDSNNAVRFGGVMDTYYGTFNIVNSTFTNNTAVNGGVLKTNFSSFVIVDSIFNGNGAFHCGGVMVTMYGSVSISDSLFAGNTASNGGVVYADYGSRTIVDSVFDSNEGIFGAVIDAFDGAFNVVNSTFTKNSAEVGTVVGARFCTFIIVDSKFTNNGASVFAGVIFTVYGLVNISDSSFTRNTAYSDGGVMYTDFGTFVITNTTFDSNIAGSLGGVILCFHGQFTIENAGFYSNFGRFYGGVMYSIECSTQVTSSVFRQNSGSLYIFGGNLTFDGHTNFDNCAEPSNKTAVGSTSLTYREGGTITSFRSTIIFNGECNFWNNQAREGGAILGTVSKILVYGTVTIANNMATLSKGGGISLHQSELEISGQCKLSQNHASMGGGIFATSTTITIVYEQATLELVSNSAENGGGMYLEVNPRIYLLKVNILETLRGKSMLIFDDNRANYGGALYVADNTNFGACFPDVECFIQTLALYDDLSWIINTTNIFFSGNTAITSGSNLYGGQFDRCVPSTFAEVYLLVPQQTYYSGVSYIQDQSDISLESMASLPARICFCFDENMEPDCSYQPPPIDIRKGDAIEISLVAVDIVNRTLPANITSSLASPDGGFREGQQKQSVGRNCTNVIFNVFSPHETETIDLFADGPCGSSSPSMRHLDIRFLNCTCPVGFQHSNDALKCECNCDSDLSPYITNCNYTTSSVIRVNTNSWITYINDTDPPGFVIHPNCPFDYCQPQTVNVSINLGLPNGADAQCAFNRTGTLCGACREHLSLSLGSSRCLPCPSHWPAVFVVILLAALMAGILLVTVLLALNITVAVGLTNSFIFYANFVSANSAVFFPSSETSFPTVFVAWLNLDLGIDVCFFDGLDMYAKTWLQLAFPVYIISLVVIIIKVCKYFPKFAKLIGRRDPIATLATLVLLSYAKLLSVTITILSSAVLDNPNGARKYVWLPDGNVVYFRGKHAALVIVALLIILVGVPYTILLLLWQWIVRAPRWKVFKWTRNTKLNAFIAAYHVPYNSKYRYWTGLLLLVRVIVYIIASVTTSENPQVSLLTTIVLVGGLLLIKGSIGVRVYKKSITDIVETLIYFNLLALAALSLYAFKADSVKQTAVAYTSTIVTLLLLVGVSIYHVISLIKKTKASVQVNEHPLAPSQSAKAIVTSSIIELPKAQSPPPEVNPPGPKTI